MAAGFIREILHPDWLANLVLVQKKNTAEWRMCDDYTTLNRHCLKDPFGLPHIHQLLIQRQDLPYYPFLTATQVIIRLHYEKKIKAKPLLSHLSVPTTTKPCRLDRRMLALLIRGPSKHA
jgi:hypothetical protein